MEQRTLIALGAFVAIVLGAWLTLRSPEKGQRIGPPPRPIAAFKAAEVKELEFTSDGKNKVAFKLDGGKWMMTAPASHVADGGLLKTALEQLEKTGFGDLVTESPQKFGDLEVADERGTRVVARDGGGKTLFDAIVGRTSSGFTMVRPAGKNEVWQATGLFKYTFTRETKLWRDHGVLDLNKDDISRLAVEAAGQKIVLERVPPADKNAEAKWKVVESSVKVEPLDDAAANNLVAGIASLRASDFADEAKADETGLATPAVKVVATVKGAPVAVLFGKQKGEDFYFQVEGKAPVYLLQKLQFERVAVAPINFRDKTLVKAKEDDLVELVITTAGDTVTLKREGAVWKSREKADLDEGKVRGVVTAFDKLEAASFLTPAEAKAANFAKPEHQVVLKLRDKSQVTLKFGGVKDGTDYFVQKSGLGDTVLVKKYNADRFLKKAADLGK